MMPLRDELLNLCRESGASVPEVAQALIDTLTFTLLLASPSVDDAERDVRNIAESMCANIRKSYDMAASQRMR